MRVSDLIKFLTQFKKQVDDTGGTEPEVLVVPETGEPFSINSIELGFSPITGKNFLMLNETVQSGLMADEGENNDDEYRH